MTGYFTVNTTRLPISPIRAINPIIIAQTIQQTINSKIIIITKLYYLAILYLAVYNLYHVYYHIMCLL